MKSAAIVLALFLLAAFITGCGEKAPVAEAPIVPIDLKTGRLIESGGVKYYVPTGAASHHDTVREFFFECEGLRLLVAQGKVFINGTRYGMVKPGDTVSFLNKGHVFVNGVQRKPEQP